MKNSGVHSDKARLLEILLKNAFFKEKIRLSSGKESDFYIDARRVTLSPEGANLCAKIILNILKDEKVDAIGGPTMGADPLVGAIAAISFEQGQPIDTFIVRKAPKPYGKQQQIEGPLLKSGAHVVLIDDVATTGQSFLQSMDVLKQLDIGVRKAVCVVDRGEGAKEALAKHSCELISIFHSSDFPR